MFIRVDNIIIQTNDISHVEGNDKTISIYLKNRIKPFTIQESLDEFLRRLYLLETKPVKQSYTSFMNYYGKYGVNPNPQLYDLTEDEYNEHLVVYQKRGNEEGCNSSFMKFICVSGKSSY